MSKEQHHMANLKQSAIQTVILLTALLTSCCKLQEREENDTLKYAKILNIKRKKYEILFTKFNTQKNKRITCKRNSS